MRTVYSVAAWSRFGLCAAFERLHACRKKLRMIYENVILFCAYMRPAYGVYASLTIGQLQLDHSNTERLPSSVLVSNGD